MLYVHKNIKKELLHIYAVRFYIGKRIRILVADEDVMKQILTKEFESFMNRPVSSVTCVIISQFWCIFGYATIITVYFGLMTTRIWSKFNSLCHAPWCLHPCIV